jgi:Coenzyme PQQ synthesis protein D (PqqD)
MMTEPRTDVDDRDVIRVREGAAVWRQIDDETVVLAMDSSMYLALNATATQLWPMLVDGATRAELVAHLQAVFDVEAPRAEADVDAFLAACARHRLLT